MGLKNIAYSMIASLSGGEKRRLSLVIALLSNVSLLILDEPFSGLSSSDALEYIEYLQILVSQFQFTVLLTIHQPERNLFENLDRIILMNKCHIILNGTPQQAIKMVEKEQPMTIWDNPADLLLDMVRSKSMIFEKQSQNVHIINDKNNHVKEIDSNNNTMNEIDNNTYYKLSWWSEFRILLSRSISLVRNNPEHPTKYSWFMAFLLSSIITIVAWQLPLDIASFQDRFSVVTLLRGMISFRGILAIFYYRPLADKIRSDVLSRKSRISTVIAAETIVHMIRGYPSVIIGVTLTVFGTALTSSFVLYLQVLILHLALYTLIDGILFWISLYPNYEQLYTMSMIPYLMSTTFDGYYISVSNTPIYWRWFTYINPFRWFNASIMTLLYSDITLECSTEQSIYKCPSEGKNILKSLDLYYPFMAKYGAIVLILFAFLFKCIAILVYPTSRRENK